MISSDSNEVLLQICAVDRVVDAASVGFLFVCFYFILLCNDDFLVEQIQA
jgi:hypothetical protein